jgi:hypothetical protein
MLYNTRNYATAHALQGEAVALDGTEWSVDGSG